MLCHYEGQTVTLKRRTGNFAMLLRFRFSNFRSIRDEQEFSMIAARSKTASDDDMHVRRVENLKEGVLTAAGIYGANGSGKTNVLRALSFMKQAVEESHRSWKPDGGVPLDRFRLNREALNDGSRMVVDFLQGGIRHEYGFVADSAAIREEWLYVYPNNKKQTWFMRRQGTAMSFSDRMPGENRVIETLMRPNSLFLSTAAQNNHDALTRVYRWFSERLQYVTSERSTRSSVKICAHPDVRQVLSQLMHEADLGLTEVRLRPSNVSNPFKDLLQHLAQLKESPEEADSSGLLFTDTIEFVHGEGNKTTALPLHEESDGTVAFFSLLGPGVTALAVGGIVLVDELDAHLHPLLATRVIELFRSPQSNPLGAQLIFTTHDTNLLRALRRDQIWFTEKNRNGESSLYPLSDFRTRGNENLESGYLQGRYGAIPYIDSDRLLERLEPVHGKDR
ncbi:MAG: ATP-binding protein [Bryobacteraceae bacterium]|nr:ATP-binding protein [Bryobacteraceae bacterium]